METCLSCIRSTTKAKSEVRGGESGTGGQTIQAVAGLKGIMNCMTQMRTLPGKLGHALLYS